LIHFENVGLRYGMGPEVLRDLTFDIPKRSFQFLTGPSGAGKTTLMRLLFMSLKPTRGLIRMFDRDISVTPGEELPLLATADRHRLPGFPSPRSHDHL
jgi:cell division transport system ATP-binding protein